MAYRHIEVWYNNAVGSEYTIVQDMKEALHKCKIESLKLNTITAVYLFWKEQDGTKIMKRCKSYMFSKGKLIQLKKPA